MESDHVGYLEFRNRFFRFQSARCSYRMIISMCSPKEKNAS